MAYGTPQLPSVATPSVNQPVRQSAGALKKAAMGYIKKPRTGKPPAGSLMPAAPPPPSTPTY